jgi:hypothetical protein
MYTVWDTGNWSGDIVAEAETIQAARRACEVLILEDEQYETLYVHAPSDDDRGEWLETATRLEGEDRDRIGWLTSDLVRRHDGRA